MIIEYLQALKNIIFPPLCLVCNSKSYDDYICCSCRDKILKDTPYYQMTYPDSKNYDRVISSTAYAGAVVDLLHRFKYNQYYYLDKMLASLMIQSLNNIGLTMQDYDYLIPIPMNAPKKKERGYNQADLLAEHIANYFKISYKDDIIYERVKKSAHVKLKYQQRKDNIKGIFYINTEADLKDKKIIVIDDAFTTGSTAAECAATLKKHGANKVTVITLTKT